MCVAARSYNTCNTLARAGVHCRRCTSHTRALRRCWVAARTAAAAAAARVVVVAVPAMVVVVAVVVGMLRSPMGSAPPHRRRRAPGEACPPAHWWPCAREGAASMCMCAGAALHASAVTSCWPACACVLVYLGGCAHSMAHQHGVCAPAGHTILWEQQQRPSVEAHPFQRLAMARSRVAHAVRA